MSGYKKTTIPRQTSYNSLYVNPLNDLKHNRSCSEGEKCSTNSIALGVHILQKKPNPVVSSDNKENVTPNKLGKGDYGDDKENAVPGNSVKALKPSSLQLCIQKNEPESKIGAKMWESFDSDNKNSVNIWDYSDSEAAPASSWSTLPNRSLLYRPLPMDIGRCTCIIVKEVSPEGFNGSLYSLYTHEGHGRQNRKLAMAYHVKRGGKSEFVVAQDKKGLLLSSADESLIGKVSANFMGSKYHIWDQESYRKSSGKQSKLLAAVRFVPTIATMTGSYRSMRAWIPKHQSMQLKSTMQVQHINGLPIDWDERGDRVHQLFSRVPHYNKISKHYELDFRDKGRANLRIQSSVKNFQLTLEKHGKQTILQLGRVGKMNYVMDYRYPLTGYQAFSICLASIDSKLCCTV